MVESRTESSFAGRAAAFDVVDVIAVVVIFCIGLWLGTHAVEAFRASGGRPSFYQSEFGPAVMLACGRGLQNPDLRDAPALAAFLSEQTDVLACSDLPPALRGGGLDPFQRACRYLEVTVALTWKATGVSWSRLSVLSGILFGVVAALTYGVFRLALSPLLAVLGMVPTLMSTSNLMLVPHLRDYAKGPFLLAVILIMGILVLRRTSSLRTIGWSATAGAVVGLGLGFRTDLMIAVAPFLCVLALLVPGASAGTRAAAAGAFLGVFALVASPMLGDYSHGNNIGPVVLLGLTEPFDRPLGVQPSIYGFGSQYNDSLIFSVVNSYAVRVEGRRQGVDLASAEHGRASMAYLGHVAATFPADFVTRTLAATRAVPSFFLRSSLYPPPWIESRVVGGLYNLAVAVSSRLTRLAVPAVLAATVMVSAASPRAAWLIVVVMLGFAGATAIQFDERHFFYLQFVPWLAFGIVVQGVMGGPALLRRLTSRHGRQAAVFAALVTVALGAATFLARTYQQRAVERLFHEYETAPRTAVSITSRPAGPDRALLTSAAWLEPEPPDGPRIATRFLAVQFLDDRCGPTELPLTLRYEAALPELDLSETRTVRLRPGAGVSTMLFFAAFDRPDGSSRFRGLELPVGQSRCLGGIFQVERLERTPLLLTAVLAADWRNDALYQRLR